MNGLTCGCWAIADRSLQWIGKKAAWPLVRRHPADDESALYAAIGGALICALIGGAVGFGLSDRARDIGGAMLGSSLGVCLGILFGSFVETVDSTIKDLLRSFNPK